jgi:flagellar basal body rod protein FlgB
MAFGFVNRVSAAPSLRAALDASATRTRAIADRVAKASLQNADGFALAATSAESPTGAQPGPPVDLEAEMVSLADEQLRFEATAKLLQGTYQKIRLAVRGTGG